MHKQLGFTIIETILFLAISSSMVFVAMTLISGRSQQVQFTDSIRSLESFFDTKISQVRNGSVIVPNQACKWSGVNYSSNAGSDGSCIFLGFMFDLNDLAGATTPKTTEIASYQMLGARLNSSDFTSCAFPSDPLYCVEPVSLPTTYADSFQIPWSVEIIEHVNPVDGTNISKIGFLRNPQGSNLIPIAVSNNYAWKTDPVANRPIYKKSITNTDSYIDDEFSVRLCFSDGTRVASINLGKGDKQLSVEAIFSDTNCPAP